ncbi:MAG: sugar transferase, partial [Chloroflexi bacterium]|nr:sugar transferase [Chloroflexota bacterium]
LLNVLKGDMSVVGPRPALYNQHELVDMRRRTGSDLMRPGLTGWAQINGRNLITVDEKVRLDAFYVRNCSIMLDARIVLRTLAVMLKEEELARR